MYAKEGKNTDIKGHKIFFMHISYEHKISTDHKNKSGKINYHFNAQMTTASIFYGEQLHQTVSPFILLQPGHKTAFF